MLVDGDPVDGPLVDDANGEVAEDGLEKDHAGEEVAPDVDGGFEVAGVDEGEAEGVGHLGVVSMGLGELYVRLTWAHPIRMLSFIL